MPGWTERERGCGDGERKRKACDINKIICDLKKNFVFA